MTKTDNRFNPNTEANKPLVDIALATGMRRSELAKLRPEWLKEQEGEHYIELPSGIAKGGRPRSIKLHGPTAADAVKYIKGTLPGNRVFQKKLPTRADIHSFRAAAAQRLYRDLVQEILDKNGGVIPKDDRYIMRSSGDDGRGGTVLSRSCLAVVSEFLGHSRLSVVVNAYLWRGED